MKKQPPNNAAAERSVLGAILLRGVDALDEVRTLIDDEDFYIPANAAVFRGMLALAARGDAIDLLTLDARLHEQDEHRLVGGIEKIGAYADAYLVGASVTQHANLVRAASMQRRLIMAGRAVIERASESVDPAEIENVATMCEQAVIAATNERSTSTLVRAGDLGAEVVRSIQSATKQGGITGIATGFEDIDRMTTGLQRGNLTIIAARPSMGKTALALNIIANAGMISSAQLRLDDPPRPTPTLLFSLEMITRECVQRIASAEGNVDSQRMRAGGMSAEDFSSIFSALERLKKSPVWIDDASTPSITDIHAVAKRWHAKYVKPDEHALILVDYLQLAKGAAKQYGTREQEVSAVSAGLKALAKDLKCSVVALSQLNRQVDHRDDHRPRLSDLRESGSIEQDADLILFLFRAERYARDEEERTETRGLAEIILAKQRSGPVGTVRLHWNERYTRFNNLAPDGRR